ncbi:MAG: spermidine/putrescine ABC transporter ATP-binding protein [Candidatus Latescibacterota bacterium]|nr:MAG: spermidine/putrescine ABC transporter ATP-binding protein [Candidatus Latescibacterota bacterium]
MVGVRLEQVTKCFGDVVAVDEVSIEIRAGELFFLLGPSGCGKTTLLRLIAGFYAPEAGRIFFGEREMSRVPPHKRNTGMVFQNYALWPHMTVWENVVYGLDVRKASLSAKKERGMEALRMVRMAEFAERTPNRLSGGQQQRIALARALVIEPDVVLLDEPLSNLDAKLRIEMREEIKRIHEQVGTTMIYVTHDQKEALSMADRLAVLDAGRIAQVGDPRTIYNNPNSPLVAGFIGETNFIHGKVLALEGGIAVDTAVGPIFSTMDGKGFAVGDPVLCSIRPEGMHIGERGTVNRISGTVSRVMYLGDNEQYFLTLSDGTSVKVVETGSKARKAEIGEQAVLSFGAEDVVVLKTMNNE